MIIAHFEVGHSYIPKFDLRDVTYIDIDKLFISNN
jgi:hypothetical protein